MDNLTERYLVSMGATPVELEHLRSIQLPHEEVIEATTEAVRGHPEESKEQCLARAKARLLWKRRAPRVTPGHEWSVVAGEVASLNKTVLRLGIAIIILLLALAVLAIPARAQVDVVRFTDETVPVATFGGPFTIECSTNLTCTRAGPVLTITASGGSSGYDTLQEAGTPLTQRTILNFIDGTNATMSCVDNAGATRTDCTVESSASAGSSFDLITNGTNSTATMTVGTGGTLTFSGTGVLNADRINGVEFTNSEGLGQIPIGQGDGTAVWADPLVQGLTAHDAVGTSTNPVAVGGYASAAAPANVSLDGDIVRAWYLLNGAQAVNLTAAGALIGGDATNGLDVDVTRSALPTGASTSANQTTIIGHVDGIEGLLTTIDADTGTLAGTDFMLGTDFSTVLGTASLILATQADNLVNTTDGLQATALNYVFDGTTWDRWTGAVSASQNGAWTVTANAGTDLNTSALLTTAAHDAAFGTAGTADAQVRSVQGIAGGTALPVSAASLPLPTGASTLAEQQTQTTALQIIDNLPVAQGSTTSGQSGVLIQGAVTTGAPTYTTAQTSPLSLTTSGELRVAGTFNAGIVQVNDDADAAQNVGYFAGDLNLPTQNVTDGADDAAFTVATDWVTVIGGVQTSDVVDAGDRAALRIDTSRNLMVNCTVGCAGGSTTPTDNFATPTDAGNSAAFNMVYDGTTWDMLRGDSVNGTLVNLGANNDVTVTGTVTANAGTDLNTSALLTTAAHDAAFGTAGTADTQVRTVQGIASGTPVIVSATNLDVQIGGSDSLVIGTFPDNEPFNQAQVGGVAIVLDPCQREKPIEVSINQTADTQVATGVASERIYICEFAVVSATAQNVAVVAGTGTTCGTSTTGVLGFGGATAATGFNLAANGGIVRGGAGYSVGRTDTDAKNVCVLQSGSGQLSGGFAYVSLTNI